MGSTEQTRQDDEHKKGAGPHSSERREGDSPSGGEQIVEMAARVYYDFCKKAARTISRLKRED